MNLTKHFILSIFILLIHSSQILAQQYSVTNGGFESWTGTELDSWTKGYLSVFTKSTDAYSGSYAMKLVNGDAQGMKASVIMDKVGDFMPVKLKWYVKYDISPNQRTHIKVSLGNTTYYNGGTSYSTTYDVAGWVSFTGNSNSQYVPFEIVMDYRLIKSIPNQNGVISFDKIKIDVDSYGPQTAETDIINDVNNPDIKANSFMMFDEFTFEGTTSNVNIPKLIGIPDLLENWSYMDNKYIPTNLVMSGSNGLSNNLNRIISRSTDAYSGDYAMSVNLSGTDANYGFYTVFDKVFDNQTEVSFSVKGTMGVTDSIKVQVGTGTTAIKRVIIGSELTSTYQTFTLDISSMALNTRKSVIISFYRNTTSTYSVLFDALEVNGDAVATAVKKSVVSNVLVGPNPTNGSFIIYEASGKKVTVYSMSGTPVDALISDMGKDIRVELLDSPKGIYFVSIDGVQMVKVIKD